MLLFAVGLSELRVTEERKKIYQTERGSWSIKLQTMLEKLAEHATDSEDDQEMDEEVTMSAAESQGSN